jgi:hypothetical protein
MHLWHYERLSELLGKLGSRFPEPVWRELAQAVSAHAVRVATPRPGRGPPDSLAKWAEWDRPFDTVPGENVQGTVFCPQPVHCAAGSLVDGAIWAGSGVTVDRNAVVEGPIVSQEQIDWHGRRAEGLIAPRVVLGRPAFPLDIRGSILCRTLVLGAQACISGALGGSLIVSRQIVRRGSGQAVRSLLVLADAAAEALDVPCGVTLEARVRIDYLSAGGNVVLDEGCRVESLSGQNVVLGAGSRVAHVHARGSLALGPGCVVQTAIAGGRITADATAQVEGDLIASAYGKVETGAARGGVVEGDAFRPGGLRWYLDPRYQYRADVAALLDPAVLPGPGSQDGPPRGWAAVRYLPHALYAQLERLQGGWLAVLQPLPGGEAT